MEMVLILIDHNKILYSAYGNTHSITTRVLDTLRNDMKYININVGLTTMIS